MKKRYLALALLSVGIFSLFPNTAHAGLWDKRTIVTFSQAVEVPGAVLQPGKYVMSLVGAPSDRNIVQFSNVRENHVYATALTINAERLEPPNKTILTFYEMPNGQPELLKEWFFPGETIGREFTYPKDKFRLISADTSRTVEIAQAAPTQTHEVEAVPPAPEPPAPEVAAAPEPTPAPKEEPVEIAQNTQPPPIADNQPAPPPASELPKTAGETPLIGLLGVLSLGAAAAFSRRTAR